MKTKLVLTFLIYYLPFYAFACRCSNNSYEKFQNADFVGIVNIIKTYKNDIDSIDKYRVDVKTIKSIKGKKIHSLLTQGYNEIPNRWSSCDVNLKVGQNYLIYGKKEKEGAKIYVYYCGYTSKNIVNEIDLIRKKKLIYEDATLRTRLIKTPSIPRELYVKHNPDSSSYVSLIEVDINKPKNKVKIRHLTNDKRNLKVHIKDVLSNKVNWKAKLDESTYPKDKHTFYFELNPYSYSKK